VKALEIESMDQLLAEIGKTAPSWVRHSNFFLAIPVCDNFADSTPRHSRNGPTWGTPPVFS